MSDKKKRMPRHPDATLTDAEIDEYLADIAEWQEMLQQVYWLMFRANVGGKFHAFMEWNGVMSKHLGMARELVEQGIDAFHMSRHTGGPMPLADHHLEYLREKIECIFDGMIEVSLPGLETAAEEEENGNA